MSTKPFEPKLPLPEAFETELMKNGIEQLQPLVNQYLQVRPIIDKQTIGSLIHFHHSSGEAALPSGEHRAVRGLAAALPVEHGQRDRLRGDTQLLHVQGGAGRLRLRAVRLPLAYLRRRTSQRAQGAAFHKLQMEN